MKIIDINLACSGSEKPMKKVKAELDDELRSEYDLKSLRVRKIGHERNCTKFIYSKACFKAF